MVTEEDYGMYEHFGGEMLNEKTKKPYLVFTPFKNFCMKNFKVPKPDPFNSFVFETSKHLLDIPTTFT